MTEPKMTIRELCGYELRQAKVAAGLANKDLKTSDPQISRLENGTGNKSPVEYRDYYLSLEQAIHERGPDHYAAARYHLLNAKTHLECLESLRQATQGMSMLPSEPSEQLVKLTSAPDPDLAQMVALLDGNINKGLYGQVVVDYMHMEETLEAELTFKEAFGDALKQATAARQQLSDVEMAQLCIRACNRLMDAPLLTEPNEKEELKRWIDGERKLAQMMVPARSRLRHLNWPEPYRSGWNFIGGHRRQDNLANKQPAHGYWGTHAFLVDVDNSALAVLHRAKFELRAAPGNVSHRATKIIPRMLVRLLDRRGPAYNALLATTDVAVTKSNPTIRINTTRYFNYVCGTYCVGVDGFTPSGVRDFDGLDPVKDDEHWLLLRSNHTPKAIRVVVSFLTGADDPHLVIVLHDTHDFEGAPFWGPSLISFASPADFRDVDTDDRLFVSGIRATAKRLLRKTLRLWNSSEEFERDVRVSVTGFALDAALGLQPTVFCLANTEQYDYREVTRAFEKRGLSARTHKIVPDNPNVSLEEIDGLSRYEQCEFLRASLYFARCWFNLARLANRRDDQPSDSPGNLSSIGWHGQQVVNIASIEMS